MYMDNLLKRVADMSIRETREVLGLMRDASDVHDLVSLECMVLPKYGFTVGEFSTAYVLGMPVRAKRDAAAPAE